MVFGFLNGPSLSVAEGLPEVLRVGIVNRAILEISLEVEIEVDVDTQGR